MAASSPKKKFISFASVSASSCVGETMRIVRSSEFGVRSNEAIKKAFDEPRRPERTHLSPDLRYEIASKAL